MKPPELRDLTAAGITTDEFIATLTSYFDQRTRATWVVRWHGRIRPIQGVCFFETRAHCQSGVQGWLRAAGRWAPMGRGNYSKLPGNWSRKKAYRSFIDALAVHLEQTGVLEYVQLQPADIQTVVPRGLQTLVS